MYDCEKSVWICVFMQYMKLWMFCIFVIFEICNSQSRSRYSEKFCIFTFYSFVMTLKMSVYSELLKKVLYSLCNFRWRVFQDPLIEIFFNYHHEKNSAIMHYNVKKNETKYMKHSLNSKNNSTWCKILHVSHVYLFCIISGMNIQFFIKEKCFDLYIFHINFRNHLSVYRTLIIFLCLPYS